MRIILLSFFLISISACGKAFNPPEGFIKLNQSEQRAGSLGFSFMTPQGEDWYEGYSESTLMYLRKTNHKELSIFAGATEVAFSNNIKTEESLKDYINSYKSDFGKDLERHKNISLDLKLENSSPITCFQYTQKSEDHKAKNLGSNKYLVLTSLGRVCLEPNKKDMLIDIYYSIRTSPKQNLEEYISEGNTFINSLKYAHNK